MAENITDSDFEVIFDSIRFNKTILSNFGLVFYPSNSTLSNTTSCYYIPRPPNNAVVPRLFANGTISPTPNRCTDPVQPIRIHGILGIVFGCLFCVSILWSSANLQRTGYVSRERQSYRSFRNIRHGERRQHYLALLTAMVGVATSFLAIDVDRETLPGLNFKLQCVFYSVLQPLLLLCLIESLRYWMWKSMHGRAVTQNTYIRDRIAGSLIGLFYLLDIVGLVLVSARNWDTLTKQWYAEQSERIAEVSGTDARFQAGYLVLSVCHLGIVARLIISWQEYRKLNKESPDLVFRDRLVMMTGAVWMTTHFVAYNLASAFAWKVSPYNVAVHQAWYYCYGIMMAIGTLLMVSAVNIKWSRHRPEIAESLHQFQRKIRAIKPAWWYTNKSNVASSHSDDLDFALLKHIRGREVTESANDSKSWWRNNTEDYDQGGEVHLEVLGSGQTQVDATTKQQQKSHRSSMRLSGVALAESSSTLEQSSRQRSQQRQGFTIKSMLDI